MADIKGLLKYERETPSRRPVPVRLRDWKEVYEDFPDAHLTKQAARCMDCGTPFCNNGCPLGTSTPDCNTLVYWDRSQASNETSHATHTLPEFTARLSPT